LSIVSVRRPNVSWFTGTRGVITANRSVGPMVRVTKLIAGCAA
jgi:hypothetical protein